jgi:hypothetical protein
MEITRTKGEIEDMLRRVTFQIDSTPDCTLFGEYQFEELGLMKAHKQILLGALGEVPFWKPPVLFEQTCWAWLCGESWDKYPELIKEDGVWHTI